MAIFKPGAIVSAISGKLGGIEFAQGKGSPHVKMHGVKGTKSTAPILAGRARVAELARRYRALSVNEKRSWEAFGRAVGSSDRLGRPRPMSGYQAWVWVKWGAVAEPGQAHWNASVPLVMDWRNKFLQLSWYFEGGLREWAIGMTEDGITAWSSISVGVIPRGGAARARCKAVVAESWYLDYEAVDMTGKVEAAVGEWPTGTVVEYEYRSILWGGVPSPPFVWRSMWSSSGSLVWTDGKNPVTNFFPEPS